MRRGPSFFGLVLLLIGSLLLLDNLGLLAFLRVRAWDLIVPLFVIFLGVWVIWGVRWGRVRWEAQSLFVPLEGARRATMRLDYGAGQLSLHGGAALADVLSGSFEGGVEHTAAAEGDLRRVALRTPTDVYGPWYWGQMSRRWDVALNGEIPLVLELNSGASDSQIDLARLQVTEAHIYSGASNLVLTLPAECEHTYITLEGGAASFTVRVPEEVALRVKIEGALYGVQINEQRFPRCGGGYQSPDYETAVFKADVLIKMGVGSLNIY